MMGVRTNDHFHLIVATAILSARVSSVEEYLDVKARIRDLALAHARDRTNREVRVDVNAADNPDDGIVYVTETGLSAEDGDEAVRATTCSNRSRGRASSVSVTMSSTVRFRLP